jgi:glycerol uptake facilitator-like aquaporin
LAIIVNGAVSGGHFNPAVTISLAIWQGFPWKKVPYYIFAQIFGGFMAGLVLMAQYWEQIQALKLKYEAAGLSLVSAGGPATILNSFPQEDQHNLGYLFMIEFFCSTFIVSTLNLAGLCTWC